MEKVFFTVGYAVTRVTCPAGNRFVNDAIRKVATIIYSQWIRRKGQRPKERQFFLNLYKDSKFPSGLLDKILPKLPEDSYVLIDQREKPSRDPRLIYDPSLYEKARWYQREALVAIRDHKRLIVKEPTGCHGEGTLILMYDGSFKKVEEIIVGDVLAGPDGIPRTVLRLYHGFDNLHKIIPVKGEPFVVNERHVLSLVGNGDSKKGVVDDISLLEWFSKSKTYKHTHKLYRTGVDFVTDPHLPISPYFLGILLGDGCLRQGIAVETPDAEVVEEIQKQAVLHGLNVRICSGRSKSSAYHLCSAARGKKNGMITILKDLRLYNKLSGDKFIPFQYKTASRKDRLELLAGLLDTDGCLDGGGYDYLTKSERLADDILFLSRSLGFAAYKTRCIKGYGKTFHGVYWRLGISGDCSVIPVHISRKKARVRKQKKDVLRTGFSVRDVGCGEYFGFQINHDGRYLLGDFTVTHNSGKTMLAACAINAAGAKTLYVVPSLNLLTQTASEFSQVFGRQNVGVIGDGEWSTWPPILVATVQSLWSRYYDDVEFNRSFDRVGMLILDECHHVNIGYDAENTWFKIANRIPAYWRIGMSATPGDANDKQRLLLEAATGLLHHETNTMDLVEQGYLVVPKPLFYRLTHDRRYKSWPIAKDVGLSGNEKRNKLLASIALSYALKHKKVLVIVDRVESHGKVLFEMIGSKRSMFIYGGDDDASRSAAKRAFESGEIPILIGTIYGEGVNMPKMDVVMNAAGGKSDRVAIQRMGRVLRLSEGKSEGVLVDVMDEDRGILYRHSLARFEAYQEEGYSPEILEYEE